MKKLNRYILVGITSLLLVFPLLIPITKAQEWTYNGADTVPIPGFFVYPSERYYYNFTGGGIDPESYMRFDIVKGNFTDTFMGASTYPGYPPLVGGSCMWGDVYMGNATSGQEVLNQPNMQLAYWNETVGIISIGLFFIPVDTTGEATAQSFEFVIEAVQNSMEPVPGVGRFEHNASYPSIYSIKLWNSSYNNAYYKMNYTENGIQLNADSYGIPFAGNTTLMSRPAQMSPDFTSLTTESGLLTTNTTQVKLIASITDADNNNDKTIDTDYQYRIYNGTDYTAWAPVTSVINYDLGPVADGSYELTMEVKNMYGVVDESITIQYTAPEEDGDGDGDEIIPSYPITIISLVAIFSVSFILLKQRKKMRF